MNINREVMSLPVMETAGRINDILRERNTLVVTAPPGAGKSTVLPLTVLEGLEPSGKILMLEPRRLAARQVAHRMAALLGENVGETAGYRIRFENKVSARTRIEVLTEGILSRMLIEDPTMDGVSVIFFDEFHERSLASDEALAFALETQRVLRPDLRIVIMSATIDAGAICGRLGAELVESRGRAYPVEIIYSDTDTSAFSCAEDVAREVLRASRKEEGDILAFLPGEAEIRRCAALLEGQVDGLDICPLYGMLPFEQQTRAIAAGAPGRRKAVLATSIAETSLTIEGVRTVIDSGLCRRMVVDQKTGQSHLETVPVSRDMADQRSGRAGRLAPGICHRLYRAASFRAMKESRTPEILEADLVPLVLDTAVWEDALWGDPDRGAADISSLPWLTPPPSWKTAAAKAVLQNLGAVDADGRATTRGRSMAKLPCHPRIARMLSFAAEEGRLQRGQNGERKGGQPSGPAAGVLTAPADENLTVLAAENLTVLAADLAAILEDRDPLPADKFGVDIDARVSALRQIRRGKADRTGKVSGAGTKGEWEPAGRTGRGGWERCIRASQQYARMSQDGLARDKAPADERTMAAANGHSMAAANGRTMAAANGPVTGPHRADPALTQPRDEGRLLATAFPERIGKLLPDGIGRYMLASGHIVCIDRSDPMSAAPWIVAASANVTDGAEGRVFLAAAVEFDDILSMARVSDRLSWSTRENAVIAAREWRIGNLLVDSKTASDVPAEKISAVLCEAAKKYGTSMLDFSDEVGNLQRRVAAVRLWHPEMDLPDLSTEAVLERAADWLPAFAGKASSAAQLKKIDLSQALWSLLDYGQQQAVERLAPSHITVPSGSRIRVEYRPGAEAPIVRVRLQECFGLARTPVVDDGRRPVLMELLSPGFKSVQLTGDLGSFWSGTYFEVRKELRRRYPKHAWPDDPLAALPQRRPQKK